LDNECNEGACDPATGECFADPLPDETPCDDGLFCTSFDGSEGGDGCLNGECVGNPVDCGDPYACTDDSCDEDADECVNAPNDGNCTGDPDDVCYLCDPDNPDAGGDGCYFDPGAAPICAPGDEVCRSAGFFGSRGGVEKGFNYTEAVLVAAGGCLEVCGVDICGTHELLGSLGSALEALCVRQSQATQLDQNFRQAVAAALNCTLSGDPSCSFLDDILVGVTWAECDANCAAGTPDVDTLNLCYRQLDCFNNGGEWKDLGDYWGCALGECAVFGGWCGKEAGDCPPNVCLANVCESGVCSLTADDCSMEACPPAAECSLTGADCSSTPCEVNACDPFPGNCHDRGLCESSILADLDNPWLICPPDADPEELGPASSSKACREALGNDCTVTTQACADNECTLNPLCPATCGNGIVEYGEACDTGGMTAECNGNCTQPVCGDGIVNPYAGEECDDGNTDDGDGCSSGCLVEEPD
jgi:cysteine-rich repeat protein